MSNSSREHCRAYERTRYATDPVYREDRKRKERQRQARVRGDVRVMVVKWASHLWRRYGLTLDAFFALFDRQRGLCALCDRALSPKRGHTCVDHDHATNRVRGLLCSLCNRSLGFYERWDKNRLAAYLHG